MNGTTAAMNRTAPARRSAVAGWVLILALLALAALFVADRLYDPEKFRIREVEVHGRFERVDGERVRAVVAQSLSGNFFTLSLPAIEARIARLPWVFSASVRRRWPATLVVEVVEVRPVARWGEGKWLNFTGDLVEREGGAASPNLPLLSAPEHRKREVWEAFRHWSARFAAHGLRLEELRLDPRGLWRLRLSPRAGTGTETAAATKRGASVTLIVRQEHAGLRIARFLDALGHRLAAEFPAMRSIDLRYPNGFAVGWKTAAHARRAQLAATR